MSRPLALILALLGALLLGGVANAQPLYGPPADLSQAATPVESDDRPLNPLDLLQRAGGALPSVAASGAAAPEGGEAPGGLSTALSIMLLLTVIALAPSIMLMTTCFVRIVIVLGLLRQALGTQSLPPTQVITSLAIFMTMLVMAPTFERIWDEAVVPYQSGEIRDTGILWQRASQPLRDYMFDQIEATGNWSSLYMVMNYRGRLDLSEPQSLTRADVELIELVPAYMLSELKTAFLLGFRVYLPFLVIDMVIASLLISMSMMMLPPVLISLPFKLLLFVLVDGWQLVVGSLMTTFAREGASPRLSDTPASGEGISMLWPQLQDLAEAGVRLLC